MAVPTTTTGVRYDGNGSSVTPYEIPFPFLSKEHITAAITQNTDGAQPELLAPSAYTVTRLPDGSGGSLTTAGPVAVPTEPNAGARITISRNTPAVQPTVLQPAGPLPAKSLETALDRALMLIQELRSRVSSLEGSAEDFVYVPTEPETARDVATWANAAARAAIVPRWTGQLGVQRDNYTIWIANSAAPGDWTEYNPHFANKVEIGYVSDAGDPGDAQDAAATLLATWALDAVLFGGDNSYNGAGSESAWHTDWEAFAGYIAAEKAFPALGNHDVDMPDWEARYAAKFPYIGAPGTPGNQRYYRKTLGGGLVDVFVLHSGRDSAWTPMEPDGTATGSTQHQWFVSQLAASRARWKIAMFHHPPASLNDGENRTEPLMNWPEFAQCDLVLCGHVHFSEILKYRGVQLVNLSASTRPPATIDDGAAGTITDGNAGDAPLWADDESFAIGRIVATQERLTVEVWATNLYYGGTRLIHSRDSREMQGQPFLRENYVPWSASELVAVGTTFFGYAAAPMMIEEVELSVLNGGSGPFIWKLWGGPVELSTGNMDSDKSVSVAKGALPTTIVPRGTPLKIEIAGTFSRNGLQVSLRARRHN